MQLVSLPTKESLNNYIENFGVILTMLIVVNFIALIPIFDFTEAVYPIRNFLSEYATYVLNENWFLHVAHVLFGVFDIITVLMFLMRHTATLTNQESIIKTFVTTLILIVTFLAITQLLNTLNLGGLSLTKLFKNSIETGAVGIMFFLPPLLYAIFFTMDLFLTFLFKRYKALFI